VRYTHEVPDRAYTGEVRRVVHGMRDRGFALVAWKNLWDDPSYKGINSRWLDPQTGQRFEVQFHTPSTFYVKNELTHEIYERLRQPGTTDVEARAIDEIRVAISSRIPIPDHAARLRYETIFEEHPDG